jgi:hypothetical protein
MARSRVSPGSWNKRNAPALDAIGASETAMRAGTGIDEAVNDGAADGVDVGVADAGEDEGGPEAAGAQATTEATRTAIRRRGVSARTQSP